MGGLFGMFNLVGAAGLEPTALPTPRVRSSHLIYAPNIIRKLEDLRLLKSFLILS